MAMDDLQQLWTEHQKSSFPPGMRGKKISNIDLTLLDADVGSCVLAVLETGGVAGVRVRTLLEQRRKDIKPVVAELQAEAKSYFQRVQKMAELVSKYIVVAGTS